MEAKQKRGVGGSPSASVSPQCDNNPANRLHGGRSYGVSRRGIRGNFVPPIKSNGNNAGNMSARNAGKYDDSLDDSTKKWLVVLKFFLLLSSVTHSFSLRCAFQCPNDNILSKLFLINYLLIYLTMAREIYPYLKLLL